MSRHFTFLSGLALAYLFLATASHAQSPCPQFHSGVAGSAPDRNDPHAACVIPEVYGPQGLLVGQLNGPDSFGSVINAAGASGQFAPAKNLFSINESVATQIALLPFVAPASGFSLVFDKALGTYVASNDSFGPIFSERASTVGRNRLAIGFSYQHMNFDSLDGVNLHSFPTLFIQNNNLGGPSCNPLIAFGAIVSNGAPPGCGPPAHDYIEASNNINLKINQYTVFATFGLTKGLDVSVAVPVLNIFVSAEAYSTFIYNSGAPGFVSFGTGILASNGVCKSTAQVGQSTTYCNQADYFNSQHNSGLGDLTIRLKGSLYQWEHAGLAAGIDIRVPTGQERDFLGTGAVGVKPFIVWSYSGRISPHVNFGYEWNGQSVLAADDITTGSKNNLPSEILYSAGLEDAITRRFTATIDLIGQTVFNGSRVQVAMTPVPPVCLNLNCSNVLLPLSQQPTIEGYKGTYAVDNASLGARLRPFGKLLVSADVLLKLDNGGLRAKAIPIASATYTF